MSVLIKGIDLPTKGNPITVTIYPDGTAEWEAQHKTGCAIPVPKHGRLIDADALEDFIRRDWDKNDHWIADVVCSRPTIIPADGQDTNVPNREEAHDE